MQRWKEGRREGGRQQRSDCLVKLDRNKLNGDEEKRDKEWKGIMRKWKLIKFWSFRGGKQEGGRNYREKER